MADAQKQPIPYQPPLFTLTGRGELIRPVAEIPNLTASSSLEVARWWYRRHLEQERRPLNTTNSYMYDLSLLQDFLGPKPVERITEGDIRRFLDLAQNKSTRKRRLTSIGGLFRYLIKDERILTQDPSDKFFPDFIQLKTPQVLFPDEQEKMLAAAREENLRTYLIVWLLLKLGLTRAELLALKVDHVDMSDPAAPLV
ncbi:MAG TPA: site-specific integrase, partial [Chloroflexia bacterium]|nr:site-specific integrase [Chloroflexia bacterium]